MLKQQIKGSRSIEYYMQLPYSILIHEIEDDGEKYWIAEIPELPGCKSHGSTVDEAVGSVNDAKRDWILDSLEESEEVPEPIVREGFSGKTLLRMSRTLHRALSLLAESEQVSLNQLIVTMLAKQVGRLGIVNRVEEKLDKVLTLISSSQQTEKRAWMSFADANEFSNDFGASSFYAGYFGATTNDNPGQVGECWAKPAQHLFNIGPNIQDFEIASAGHRGRDVLFISGKECVTKPMGTIIWSLARPADDKVRSKP